jgi:glycosyltransferase involved in cell wall biosynthesis
MQNKILEAMAMKLPCITSNLANSAIQAQNGKEIIVCAKPDEYINSVLELINDNLRYDTIASNGYDFVRSNYNWNRIVSRLNDIMKNATP